jgi:hypothetical protein
LKKFPTLRGKDEIQVFQTYDAGPFITSAASSTSNSFIFQLSLATKYADFVNVFDQYRINCAELTFVPRANEALSSTGQTASLLGTMYLVPDFDDGTNLTSEAQALAYNEPVIKRLDLPWKVSIVPRLALAAYTGTFTGYANLPPQWLDTANATVQHYGVKVLVNATATVQYIDVYVKLSLSFRAVRGL